MDNLEKWIPKKLFKKFEFYNYNHALEILSQSFDTEFSEILKTLGELKIGQSDLIERGGNESPIPPKFSAVLEPLGWKEIRISGDLIVKIYPRKGGKKSVFSTKPTDQKVLENYIDGHNIDFVKNRVALDVEWNSKDQTFDRDLFAMRTYYECDIISV